MTYRTPCGDDAAEMIRYLKSVGSESDNLTFGAEGLPVTEEQERKFLSSIGPNAYVVSAVDDDGRITGDASLERGPRRLHHAAELGISTLKEYWGRGIGSRLMEEMIAYAKENGITKINLRVRADNERAKALYKKFGFVKEGDDRRMMEIGGEYFDGEHWGLVL